MSIKDKALAVKNHVVEHKTVYIVGGVCFVVGVAGTLIVCSRPSTKVTVDSWKVTMLKWKSPTTNHVETILVPRGNSGNFVRCVETGVIFPSQNYAADLMGISASNLAQHLNGKYPHVGGFTFERIKRGDI